MRLIHLLITFNISHPQYHTFGFEGGYALSCGFRIGKRGSMERILGSPKGTLRGALYKKCFGGGACKCFDCLSIACAVEARRMLLSNTRCLFLSVAEIGDER